MKIYVNNKWLDMPKESGSITFKNIRFSDVLQDVYSTDISLPLTSHNMTTLDVWGWLDRGGQREPRMTNCMALVGSRTYAARLSVTSVDSQAITATLYLSVLPSDLLSQPVNRLLVDEQGTILKWRDYNMELTDSPDDINFSFYDYGIDFQSVDAVPYAPNVKVNSLLSWIGTAAGCTLPTVSESLRIVGTRRMVCPQNSYMLTHYKDVTSSTLGVKLENCGQHVAIEKVDEKTLKVKKICTASMHFMVRFQRVGLTGSGDGALVVNKNGTMVSAIHFQMPSDGGVYHASYDFPPFSEGDTLTVDIQVNEPGIYTSYILMKIDDYAIDEDDYNIAMNWVSTPVPAWVITLDSDAAWCYFGMMCNLPSFSTKDLLSSLAWKFGQKIIVEGLTVSFGAMQEVTVDGSVLSMSPMSAELGKVTKVVSANDEQWLSVRFDSESIADEVELHKSIFAKLQENTSLLMVTIPEETWGGTTSGATTPEFKATEGVALCVFDTGALHAENSMSLLGLEALSRIMECQLVTRDDVTTADYITIDGHRYLVIDIDTDTESNISTINALLS